MMQNNLAAFVFLQRRPSASPASSSGNPNADRPRSPEAKKLKKEDDDGEKSDGDLVVDDNNAEGANNGTSNGNRSPKENGTNGDSKKDPHSPSSQRSTPGSTAKKEGEKPAAPAGAAGASPGLKLSPPVSKALAGLGKMANFAFGKRKRHFTNALHFQATHFPKVCRRQVSLTALGLRWPEQLIPQGHYRPVLLVESRKLLYLFYCCFVNMRLNGKFLLQGLLFPRER